MGVATHPCFLGFDLSTQSLSVTLIECVGFTEDLQEVESLHSDSSIRNDKTNNLDFKSNMKNLKIIYTHSVPYTAINNSQSPVTINVETGQATQPVSLYLEAFDMICDQIVKDVPEYMSFVTGISASCQQHGSVWWAEGCDDVLKNMDLRADEVMSMRRRSNRDMLSNNQTNNSSENTTTPKFTDLTTSTAFTLPYVPIWLDSSTHSQVSTLKTTLTNPSVAQITGTEPQLRFTASQIMKVYEEQRCVYDCTYRIHLISTFVSALFVGSVGGMVYDLSDACGMNMVGVEDGDWDDRILRVMVGGGDESSDLAMRLKELRTKLGPSKPAPSSTVIGTASSFLRMKLNLPPTATTTTRVKIVSSTGDNPSTVAGLGMRRNDLVISLGTSDTVMGTTTTTTDRVCGGVNVNANVNVNSSVTYFVDPCCYVNDSSGKFVGMICASNGGLVRDDVCEMCCGGNWDVFDDIIDKSAAGNNGKVVIRVDALETCPCISRTGVSRRDLNTNTDRRLGLGLADDERFTESEEVRGIVESRMMSFRLCCESCNLMPSSSSSSLIEPIERVIVTGGGSSSTSILQIISDIFNADVYTVPIESKANTNKGEGTGKVKVKGNGAALGSALRAVHGTLSSYLRGECRSFHLEFLDVCGGMIPVVLKCSPDAVSVDVYDGMIAGFGRFEREVVRRSEERDKREKGDADDGHDGHGHDGHGHDGGDSSNDKSMSSTSEDDRDNLSGDRIARISAFYKKVNARTALLTVGVVGLAMLVIVKSNRIIQGWTGGVGR